MGKTLERAVGVLNGTIGDHLARSGNGLATVMALVHEGRALPIRRDALARAHPAATGRVALLVHGIMGTESDWAMPDGSDYGSLLARDLGFTPLYLRYNSGVAIADSGASLARALEALALAYPAPIEEILPIGYSLGGLVVRSACHAAGLAGHRWLPLVRRAIYVGTPHLGSPLERVGRIVVRILNAVDDPVTRLIADIADLRSDCVKDLGDADLRHEDRAGKRAAIGLRDSRHPVPLLPGIRHHLIAGALSVDPRLALLFGDAIVPVSSATFGACTDRTSLALPPDHVKVVRGVGHVALAHDAEVYAQIRGWCEAPT